jgi:preprotein translocase subunit YajC
MSTRWQSWWFIAQQQPPAGDAADGIRSFLPVLPWIMIGILFYLMLVRPERRKRAELDNMLKSLKKNDRVVTVGGIFGTVVQASQDADEVTLRIDESNNTRIRVLRSSISRVLTTSSSAESVGGEGQGSTG